MSRTADIAQSHKTRGIVAFLLIASTLGVNARVSNLARSSFNIVGDCIRRGGSRVAER